MRPWEVNLNPPRFHRLLLCRIRTAFVLGSVGSLELGRAHVAQRRLLAAEVHRWLISGCDGEALYLRCELVGLVPERLPHDLARGGLEGTGLYRAGLCVEPYESGSIVHRKLLS